MIHKICSLVISSLISFSCFAHALRIETEQFGKLNNAHSVRVLYGEYAEQLNEDVQNWYSNVKNCKLILVSPSGEKSELITTVNTKVITSNFTPSENGLYTLYIIHTCKDVDGDWLYQFNSFATVLIGTNLNSVAEVKNGEDLQLVIKQAPNEISGIVYFRGKPLANAHIEVVSPNFWIKKIQTDSNGVFVVSDLGSGTYYLEASSVEKVTGIQSDITYNNIWRCITTLTHVKAN